MSRAVLQRAVAIPRPVCATRGSLLSATTRRSLVSIARCLITFVTNESGLTPRYQQFASLHTTTSQSAWFKDPECESGDDRVSWIIALDRTLSVEEMEAAKVKTDQVLAEMAALNKKYGERKESNPAIRSGPRGETRAAEHNLVDTTNSAPRPANHGQPHDYGAILRIMRCPSTQKVRLAYIFARAPYSQKQRLEQLACEPEITCVVLEPEVTNCDLVEGGPGCGR